MEGIALFERLRPGRPIPDESVALLEELLGPFTPPRSAHRGWLRPSRACTAVPAKRARPVGRSGAGCPGSGGLGLDGDWRLVVEPALVGDLGVGQG